MLYLCFHCNHDLRVPKGEQEITCQSCRASGFFSDEEIADYEARSYSNFAVYSRPLGYPEQIKVEIPGDTPEVRELEARRIAPKGKFKYEGMKFANIEVCSSNNEITVDHPGDKTLEDTRKSWDRAPSYCY